MRFVAKGTALFLLLPTLIFTNCSAINKLASPSAAGGSPAGSALKSFGYAAIDCGWNDPFDASTKDTYADEVASFTNIAQLCVNNPADDLHSRLQNFKALGLKAILYIQPLFFQAQTTGIKGGSGLNFDLYANYAERWQQFLQINKDVLTPEYLSALYPADEPTWTGIVYSELNPVTELLKKSLPQTPILLIEAFAALDSLQIPVSVDWVGMDKYGSANIQTDLDWQADYAKLKAKRFDSQQKLVLVMDAQWLDAYGQAGYSQADMAAVDSHYLAFAQKDPEVVAMIGYLWAGGLDSADQRGVRDLPDSVRQLNIEIGKIITGK